MLLALRKPKRSLATLTGTGVERKRGNRVPGTKSFLFDDRSLCGRVTLAKGFVHISAICKIPLHTASRLSYDVSNHLPARLRQVKHDLRIGRLNDISVRSRKP